MGRVITVRLSLSSLYSLVCRFTNIESPGLVYPGLGLGVIISKATHLTDSMLTAGVTALSKLSPALNDPNASLLPALEDLRKVSLQIATAVANAARKEGVSLVERKEDWTDAEIREFQWDPGELLLLFPRLICGIR